MPEVKMDQCSESSFFVHFCNQQLWNDAPLIFKGDGRYGKMLQDDREREYARTQIGPGTPVINALFDSGFSRPKATVGLHGISCSVAVENLEAAMEAVAEALGIAAPLPQLS